ncbi:MAG: hypothetical protein V8Q84_03820 [Bilophila sp.]
MGAIIMVKDGEQVFAGDVIARKPRETSKTRDIVGGLPRVAELFEVRKPKDMAVVSEIAGTVSFAGEARASASSSSPPKWASPRNTSFRRASTSRSPTATSWSAATF